MATSTQVDIRSLLKLAVPSTIFTVLTHAYRSIDQYWIQGVSVEAQAAIGASMFVLILYSGFFEVIAVGAAPLVARATGAGDSEGIRRSLGSAMAGGLILYVVIAIAGGLGADLIAEALGLSGDTAAQASIYLATIAVTSLPLVLTPLVDLSFVAIGSARAPMLMHIISITLNIILTPLLIYDAGWGIAGAAIASNFARGVATGIGLYILWKQTGLRASHIRVDAELRRVIKVGFPVGTGTMAYALVYWAMLKTSISPLGPEVNAALGIGFSALEGFTWPSFHGVSLAVSSFVGRALGANSVDNAWRAIRLAFPLITALGVIATAAFYFGGPFLTGLFASDDRVHAAATEYAVILAASQLCVAYEALYEGVLVGAGDTRKVFWLNVPINISRVPLAWWLAFEGGMGAAGIWWAINVTTFAKAALKAAAVYRGRWTQIAI